MLLPGVIAYCPKVFGQQQNRMQKRKPGSKYMKRREDMMRGLRKCVSAVTAAAMLFTSVLPASGLSLTAYAAGTENMAAAVDTSVRLLPSQVSPFNDTDWASSRAGARPFAGGQTGWATASR